VAAPFGEGACRRIPSTTGWSTTRRPRATPTGGSRRVASCSSPPSARSSTAIGARGARTGARDRPAASARGEVRRAAGGARAPKKSHPVLFRSKGDLFAFIEAERAHHSVASLCRRYAVTPAGFYAWRRRGVSAHAEQDRRLATEIARLFVEHRERYGSPRIQRLLQAAGWVVSRRRVARLMRAARLRAKAVRGYRSKANTLRLSARHPDRRRGLVATRPDQVWVGDRWGTSRTCASRAAGAISRS